MNINYDKIANSVIEDAVKHNLKTELRKHCLKVAQEKSKSWLQKNKKAIEASIEAKIEAKMKVELPAIIVKAANSITVKAPKKYHSYY